MRVTAFISYLISYLIAHYSLPVWDKTDCGYSRHVDGAAAYISGGLMLTRCSNLNLRTYQKSFPLFNSRFSIQATNSVNPLATYTKPTLLCNINASVFLCSQLSLVLLRNPPPLSGSTSPRGVINESNASRRAARSRCWTTFGP